MSTVKVVPRSLTDAYKRREGDFSPNLVGLQFTDGASLFTFGNFQITTNLDRKINKNFTLGGEWSNYYDLENLQLTNNTSTILMSNDLNVRLNFDINKIDRYVYFGSFYEFARVTIEQIISKWKGSIYLNPTLTSNVPVNTVLSFSYDSGNDKATFLIPKSVISNPFELIVDNNSDFSNLTPSDIFNLSRDYNQYVIQNGSTQVNVIGYTGSSVSYPYIKVVTKGNPFPSLTASTFGQMTYHLKPNDNEVELFFTQLEDFEKILLNRLTVPIYTSSFTVPQEADGFIVFNDRNLTWPVTDGYNLDINTNDYATYVENMLEMASLFDSFKTDLVSRRFVSESIHEFDTDGGGDEIYGRKATKMLRIYGREFDQVKKYIDGISFANVVTYNKLDNTSDELIKIMAKNLGFDVLLTVTTDNFDLQQQIQPSYETVFSGHSRSLSAKELDIELWRRLVINAWWLFKSKGTRKVIEFFFNLFNIPGCMVTLDEYIYLAENKLDFNSVWDEITKIYGGLMFTPITESDLPMDSYGFPRIPLETNDNYFQMNGFWYNGGNESTVGNNPHIGTYDYGQNYFDQFKCFISDFDQLITGSTLVTIHKNYFNNYNDGTFIFDQNGLPVPYYGTPYAETLNNGLTTNAIVNTAGLTYVGGSDSPKYGVPSGDTYSMHINFTTGDGKICTPPCGDTIFGQDGIVYTTTSVKGPLVPITNQECCHTYWLPTEILNPVTVCPNAKTIMESAPDSVYGPCVILDSATKQTVAQSCCDRNTLGVDVVWFNGKCLDSACAKSSGILRLTEVPPSRAVSIKTETVSATSLFSPTQNNLTQPFTCYWCPPDSQIQTICNPEELILSIGESNLVSVATSLGWTPDLGISPSSYIVRATSELFKTYGCLIQDVSNKPIKNQSCCTLKGGTWTKVGDKFYCMKPPTVDPCAGFTVNSNHVFIDAGGNLLSQNCCTTLGYSWTDGTINVASGNPLQDNVGMSYANKLGLKAFCTACPTDIMYVDDCSIGSCVSVVKDGIKGTDMTQNCCTDYGFTWDTTNSRCLQFPPPVVTGGVTVSSGSTPKIVTKEVSLNFGTIYSEFGDSTRNTMMRQFNEQPGMLNGYQNYYIRDYNFYLIQYGTTINYADYGGNYGFTHYNDSVTYGTNLVQIKVTNNGTYAGKANGVSVGVGQTITVNVTGNDFILKLTTNSNLNAITNSLDLANYGIEIVSNYTGNNLVYGYQTAPLAFKLKDLDNTSLAVGNTLNLGNLSLPPSTYNLISKYTDVVTGRANSGSSYVCPPVSSFFYSISFSEFYGQPEEINRVAVKGIIFLNKNSLTNYDSIQFVDASVPFNYSCPPTQPLIPGSPSKYNDLDYIIIPYYLY